MESFSSPQFSFVYGFKGMEKDDKRHCSKSEFSSNFPYLRFMFPTPKNSTFSQNTFGRLAKPQIYDLVSYTFGSIMVSVSKGEYRYGMNTQEKDNEIYGEGNSYSAEYWQYDARLARRWNVDPRPNPSISTYATFANNPLLYNDKYGDTVRTNNLSSYNEPALLPLAKSSVVSEFIKQFGAANGDEFINSNSKYGNIINLNLNSVTEGASRQNMITNSQNATTDFNYKLSDGTSVAVELYSPRQGINVTGISININVLSGVYSSAESAGNNKTTAAIRSSRAITVELFTSVSDFMSLLNENMNSDGEINYVGLSNSFRSGSATPNNTALPAALNNIANSVPNSSGLFYQYDIIDKGSGTVVDSPVIPFRDVFLDSRTNFNIFSNSTLNTCSNSIPNRPSSGLASPATICNPTPQGARNPN